MLRTENEVTGRREGEEEVVEKQETK